MEINASDLMNGYQAHIGTLARMHAEQFALVQALERENISLKQQLATLTAPKPDAAQPE